MQEASAREVRKPPTSQHPAKLMHRHEIPNGDVGETSGRNTALQMTAGFR
jgi:hypothetical protein